MLYAPRHRSFAPVCRLPTCCKRCVDACSFGDTLEQVEKLLGAPTDEVGNGWIYYQRVICERTCMGARSISLGLQFAERKANSKLKEAEGGNKSKKGSKEGNEIESKRDKAPIEGNAAAKACEKGAKEDKHLGGFSSGESGPTLQAVRIMPAVISSKKERSEAMNPFIIQVRRSNM